MLYLLYIRNIQIRGTRRLQVRVGGFKVRRGVKVRSLLDTF